MKLVIATPLYPPEIGGPATYAKLLAEGLPAQGIDVEVVKFSTVRHLPKLVRHYAYYRRMLKAARGADMVLALDPVSVGLPAMKAAQKAGKPFVVKIVGDYAWEQGQQRFGITASLDEFIKTKEVPVAVQFLRKIQTRVARSATRVIVPSSYLKTVVTAWGIDERKIEVIYNAITLEKEGKIPAKVVALPRPLVVAAGRLVPWKGVGGIIEAVAHTSGVSLAIVGDGPDRASLEALSKEKLGDRAVCTGKLSHAHTLAVIASADVFVLNSTYEGLSHLLVEAQTLGVPTIATNVGGNPEVITNESNGLLIPTGDTQALIEALVRVLPDTQLQKHLAENARAASKKFSIETMLLATSTFLKQL
jgi:glycosyltransferase involved in cell wall biosynthesis